MRLFTEPFSSAQPTLEAADVLGQEADAFLAAIHNEFELRRQELLALRAVRQQALDDGRSLDFLADTQEIREGSWLVAQPPADLMDRRVEITGPTDRHMMVNALNSGAAVYMADFEDAAVPTWQNLIVGQKNLYDAVHGTLSAVGSDGQERHLHSRTATLIVRPRGLHLDEPHFRVEGKPVAASFFDAGLYIFNNAKELLRRGSGPYLYLAKLENHLEARLWNEVLSSMETALGIPQGSTKVSVLIETLPAAFEMEEILYELRARSPALNAGRWDYLFSAIKTRRADPRFVLPDRDQVKMTAPCMRAYAQLLVKTCHRRGAYAIGGMSAYVPNRKNPVRNRLAVKEVWEDKMREASDGFDGTWVAHPDLVPVAMKAFQESLNGRRNQLDRVLPELDVRAGELLDCGFGEVVPTKAGLSNNLRIALHYLSAWKAGTGAVAIDNKMEDTATAEIARAQVWQWVQRGIVLDDGTVCTPDVVRALLDAELVALREDDRLPPIWKVNLDDARDLLERLILGEPFVPFLTLEAAKWTA
jgi:malate synthase